MAEIAVTAEVSVPTVSKVLNGRVDVAAETRQRVLDAIEQLGYVPHHAARSLRGQRTFTIAGVIPDITNPFYPAFERGVQDVAEAAGFDLVTWNTDGVGEKERKAIRAAREGRVAGLIVTPFHLEPDDLLPLAEDGIAVVVNGEVSFDATPAGIDMIFVDNPAAAAAAVNYLIARGHARIGMIAGEEGTPPREGRVRGYVEALRANALPLDPVLIRHGDFAEAGGYHAAGELLKLPDRPTAVFAANDLMAMGAMIRFREEGIRVPEEIAIVGYDDIPAARLVHPPLTTFAQYPERPGRRAAVMVAERLEGRAPATGRREALPYDLIVRESA
jgi:LacI family transcriptional regulator